MIALDGEVASLKQSVSDGKELVATSITGKDTPVNGSDSFQQIASSVDSIRNNFATTITSKGIEASGVESFDDLRDKVEQIEIEKHANIPKCITNTSQTVFEVSTMVNHRSAVSATASKEEIYFMGGTDFSENLISNCELYNINTGLWTSLQSLPYLDIFINVFTNDKIYLFPNTKEKPVLIYDIKSNIFSESATTINNLGIGKFNVNLSDLLDIDGDYINLLKGGMSFNIKTETFTSGYNAIDEASYFYRHKGEPCFIKRNETDKLLIYRWDNVKKIWSGNISNDSITYNSQMNNSEVSFKYHKEKLYSVGGYCNKSGSISLGMPLCIELDNKSIDYTRIYTPFYGCQSVLVGNNLYAFGGINTPYASWSKAYNTKLYCIVLE